MRLSGGMSAPVVIVALRESGAAQGQKPGNGGRNQQFGHGISGCRHRDNPQATARFHLHTVLPMVRPNLVRNFHA
jgi:hypothetical protein